MILYLVFNILIHIIQLYIQQQINLSFKRGNMYYEDYYGVKDIIVEQNEQLEDQVIAARNTNEQNIIEQGENQGNIQENIVNNSSQPLATGQNKGVLRFNQQNIINNANGNTVIFQGGFFRPKQQIINTERNNKNRLYLPKYQDFCCISQKDSAYTCSPNCKKPCCNKKVKSPFYQKRPFLKFQCSEKQKEKKKFYTSQHFNKQPKSISYVIYHKPHLFWQPEVKVQLTQTQFHNKNISSIQKVKCYQDSGSVLRPNVPDSHVFMKIVANGSNLQYAFYKNEIKEYVKAIILRKLGRQYNQDRKFQSVKGAILKKSYYLGNWQSRFVTIKAGSFLKSFRNINQNQTVNIPFISQFWTWFEIINEFYLVIKIKINVIKYEFAIPLNDDKFEDWLEGFLQLF